MDARAVAAELRAQLRGKVAHQPRDLARNATDFGRIVRKSPAVVVQAAGEEDVAACFSLANHHRIPVTLRGCGHCCNGQSLSDGGILLVNASGPSIPVRTLDEGLVEVHGRSRWSAVEKALNRNGRSIPVLADYLHLTVGGTLSVGGYGMDSIREGAQVDGVRRLRVVKPDGEAVWCSASESPELFRHSLCGLGRAGFIERAILETRPYQRLTTFHRFTHENLTALVDSLRWMGGWQGPWPDLFKAFCARGKAVSLYGFRGPAARGAFPLAAAMPPRSSSWTWPAYRWLRSASVALWVARYPNHFRLWSDYLFDFDGLQRFAAFLRPLLAERRFAKALKSIYILAIRRPPSALRFPFEAAGEPGQTLRFGIGLYCMIPRRAPELLAAADEASQACLAECISLGGRPYLYGWHRLGEDQRRRLYGPAYDQALAVQRGLDCSGILAADKLLRP